MLFGRMPFEHAVSLPGASLREHNGYALPKHVIATPEAPISGKEKGENEGIQTCIHVCSQNLQLQKYWLPLPLAPTICQGACSTQLQIYQEYSIVCQQA